MHVIPGLTWNPVYKNSIFLSHYFCCQNNITLLFSAKSNQKLGAAFCREEFPNKNELVRRTRTRYCHWQHLALKQLRPAKHAHLLISNSSGKADAPTTSGCF